MSRLFSELSEISSVWMAKSVFKSISKRPLANETYLRHGNEGRSARSFDRGPLMSSADESIAVTFISSMRLKDLLKNMKRLDVFSRL